MYYHIYLQLSFVFPPFFYSFYIYYILYKCSPASFRHMRARSFYSVFTFLPHPMQNKYFLFGLLVFFFLLILLHSAGHWLDSGHTRTHTSFIFVRRTGMTAVTVCLCWCALEKLSEHHGLLTLSNQFYGKITILVRESNFKLWAACIGRVSTIAPSNQISIGSVDLMQNGTQSARFRRSVCTPRRYWQK